MFPHLTFNLSVQNSVWVVLPFERGDCTSKAKAGWYSLFRAYCKAITLIHVFINT